MSLSLQEVFSKVDQDVGLVFDEPIFYLVFNNKSNTFTDKTIARINELLDQVDANKNAAVLVTISASKNFSTGFNMAYWAEDFSHPIKTLTTM